MKYLNFIPDKFYATGVHTTECYVCGKEGSKYVHFKADSVEEAGQIVEMYCQLGLSAKLIQIESQAPVIEVGACNPHFGHLSALVQDHRKKRISFKSIVDSLKRDLVNDD